MTLSDVANSPEELLDIVNDADEVVGQAARLEVHSEPPLPHREVAILLHDAQKRVLLQQRSKYKKPRPGVWTITAAGHVTAGQDPQTTAHTELREEIGLQTDLRFVYKEFVINEKNNRFMYRFVGTYHGQETILNPHEVEQVRLVDKQELEQMIASGEIVSPESMKFIEQLWNGEFETVQ